MAALAFTTPDALRAHLNARNLVGKSTVIVGLDDRQRPFLAQFMGLYAETIAIIFSNPWDEEESSAGGPKCDKCGAYEIGIDETQLTYPVVVMEL